MVACCRELTCLQCCDDALLVRVAIARVAVCSARGAHSVGDVRRVNEL